MYQRSTDRSPLQRSTDKSPLQRSTDRSPLPRSTDKSPLPRSTDRSPLPRSTDRSPLPRSTDRSPLPRSTGRSPLPRSTDRSPLPRSTDRSPLPRSTDRSPIQITPKEKIAKFSESLYDLKYLYDLESKLYRANINYTSIKDYISDDYRIKLIDWVYDVSYKIGQSLLIPSYCITLFDIYVCYNTIDDDKMKLYLCMFLDISEHFLGIVKSSFNYLRDYIYFDTQTTDNLITTRSIIINFFEGILIRPSPILFNFKNDETFIFFQELSYLINFSSQLMVYEPSLISETLHYIITGNTSYNYNAEICNYIMSLINNFPSNVSDHIYEKLNHVKNHINKTCPNITSSKNFQIVNYSKPENKIFDTIGESYFLGSGGGGTVSKIKSDNNYYALKKEIIDEDYKFYVELACLNLLKDSKYVVSLKGYSISPKNIDIVLELGQYSLTQHIHKKTESNFNMAKPYILDILKGLDICQYYNIIHSDVKPDNIVWFENRYKLIDFGLSSCFISSREKIDISIGTIPYIAPEIILQTGNYDYTVDIWCAGMVFYFMATGKHLFKGDKWRGLNFGEKIFSLLGIPDEKTWPGVTSFKGWQEKYNIKYFPSTYLENKLDKQYLNLILNCLTLNNDERPYAIDIINHIDSQM
jgi:negative regulator of PHO system